MEVTDGRQVILVVDDEPRNIDLLAGILADEYRVVAATSGERCLEVARAAQAPDLILLDVNMPGLDGYEVCRRLKSSAATRGIPVIFFTGRNDALDEEHGFSVGAVDYITKPVSAPTVRARVRTQLALHDQSRVLEEQVSQRTRELVHAQDAAFAGLATLAEYRDTETGTHIGRTRAYVSLLATGLLARGLFRDTLDGRMADLFGRSAPLHDIGKVAIPDSILRKPGKLTPEEFEQMKAHTTAGGDAIAAAERALEEPVTDSFLSVARDIAYSHHERWDGRGYPQGLTGEETPLAAQVMALCDVYDALVTRRVYKPPMSHAKACEIILEGSDGHFDPVVAGVFAESTERFRQIAYRHADSDEERQAVLGEHE